MQKYSIKAPRRKRQNYLLNHLTEPRESQQYKALFEGPVHHLDQSANTEVQSRDVFIAIQMNDSLLYSLYFLFYTHLQPAQLNGFRQEENPQIARRKKSKNYQTVNNLHDINVLFIQVCKK